MTPDVKIPEGIPTWVAATSAVQPVVSVSTPTPTASPEAPASHGEWKLDIAIKSIVTFLAKLLGKPDPITGQTPVATTPVAGPAAQVTNFADKMWSAANKVVDKATVVATQTAETAKATVNQAVEGVQDVKADIDAVGQTAPQAATQPLETLEKVQ